jgi:diguanylate cyclase (GGDEF)-like protein
MKKYRYLRKLIYITTAVTYFLVLLFINYFGYLWDSQLQFGMTFLDSGKGLVVTKIKSGGIAEKGGIKPKDVLLKVNGEKLSTFQEYRENEKIFWKIKKVKLTFLRNVKTFHTVLLLSKVNIPWRTFLPLILITGIYLSIGFFSLWKRSDDLRVKLLFLLTVLAPITFVVPDYLYGQMEPISLFLALLYYISSGILIGVEPHLAMVIPRKKAILEKHPWITKLMYTSGGFLGILNLINYLDAIYHFGYPSVIAKISNLSFQITYNLIVPIAVFGILSHTFRKLPLGVKKSQTKVVLYGIFPWSVSMVTAFISLTIRGEFTPFLLYFNLLATIPVPIAFSIAVFKYHLFKIELVIRKSLIYGFLTGFLFLFYYGIIGLGSGVFSIFFIKVRSIWVIAFATLLLGILFNPLKNRIYRYVDKYFYPEKYNLYQELPELSKEIASITNLNQLINIILEKLSLLLNMNSSAFLLSDEKLENYAVTATRGAIKPLQLERSVIFSANEEIIQYVAQHRKPLTMAQFSIKIKESPGFFKLKKFQPELIVPFFLKDKLIAILLLGGKHSQLEGKYDREERDLLSMFSNQAAAMLENARLFQFASFDDLTGLYRRHIFEEELFKEVERTRRFHHPIAVGIIDIDHFKKINDTYGHTAGDLVLKNLAECLKAHIRRIDCLARYGGDEFAFFLTETNIEEGKKIGEKFRNIVENFDFLSTERASPIKVTISAGMTWWNGKPGDKTSEVLIKSADQALYQAKRRGRNRIEISTSH